MTFNQKNHKEEGDGVNQTHAKPTDGNLAERNKEKSILVIKGDEDLKRVGGSTWSEYDEIALLKGMVDYRLKKGVDPYGDMGEFFDYIKSFIRFDVHRRQLTYKLWRLKTKYVRNEFVVSKPHDKKLLKFAKKIKSWGVGGVVKGTSKKKMTRGKDLVKEDGGMAIRVELEAKELEEMRMIFVWRSWSCTVRRLS